jgi:hypothetical protein
MAYKALVVPRLGYAGPLWMPVRNSLKHQVLNLQLVQNAALRTITGCHAAASKQHLHNECSILPIHKHVSMQCRQFLANTRQRHHPSSEVISLPPGRRPNRKPILQHSFGSEVKRFETDGAIPQITFTRAVKSLHMEAVAAALSSAGPNRVLGARPPVVDPSEATGTTLSQLWSDFCKHLRSYKHFINNTTDDSCLNCQTAPHREKKKIFSCPASPTQLVPLDLWVRPHEVASFLASLPSFSHLPPVVPLVPPSPPPEPPPSRRRGPLTHKYALFARRFLPNLWAHGDTHKSS